MTNLFATYQTGYDVIGDYASTPEQARRSALSYSKNSGEVTINAIERALIREKPSAIRGEVTIVPVSSIED